MKRADEWETVPVRVRGIPARALVTEYEAPEPGNEWCPPSSERIAWELTDRHGYYPVRWLDELLTEDEAERVHVQVVAGVHAKQAEAQREAEEARAEGLYG